MNRLYFALKNSYSYLKHTLNLVSNNFKPPFPDYALALDVGIGNVTNKSSPLSTLKNIINEGFLWAVPKSRRSLERRMTRRMGYGKMILPKNNIVVCDACGHFHLVHNLCGECYGKVKQETKIMQEAILKELKLEPIDREVVVLYEDDAKDEKSFQGKRIVELPKERPQWFSRNLLAKDSELPRKKSRTLSETAIFPRIENADK